MENGRQGGKKEGRKERRGRWIHSLSLFYISNDLLRIDSQKWNSLVKVGEGAF